MLHELPAYRTYVDRLVSVDDITMILAVRAHADNPWVLERLEMHAAWYAPRPAAIIVLDFGSVGEHRKAVEQCCQRLGYRHHYVDDTGTFSLARARNLAFAETKTSFVLFNDVDCVGTRDFFVRLVETANALRLGSSPDQMINLPVYHLTQESSEHLISISDPERRSLALHRMGLDAAFRDFGKDIEFIAPYSNIFLCHRDFFDLVGGYDESFRGHGSEDFELLLRFSLHMGALPVPEEPTKDCYGPLKDEFFGVKPYKGFRRLFELLAFPTEIEGLRVFHVHHPKPEEDGSGWYKSNDWKRKRFDESASSYLESPTKLLERDWLPREKTCLVLLKHQEHAGFFIPLRLAGYRLESLPMDEPRELGQFVDRIAAGEFDAVAIFNPYMKSHADLRPYFELAKSHGATPIVVERGALPESWYYAPAVSYDDPEFLQLDIARIECTEEELAIARAYREELGTGRSALEQQEDPLDTAGRLTIYKRTGMRSVLVPLQLDDDMAVTRFTDGFPSYPEYLQELFDGMGRHQDVLFFVKPHPLAKEQLPLHRHGNVVLCTHGENIHTLIDSVDAVICYNSGVGLLAALQGKRIVTFGNAFYNRPGIGYRARTLDEAIALALDRRAKDPSAEDLDRLLAWIMFRKYSFFKAESVLREFEHRRSHGYRDQRCYHLMLPGSGVRRSWLRASWDRPVGMRSYAAGRIGLRVQSAQKDAASLQPPMIRVNRRRKHPVVRKLRKLVRNPAQFFADSNHGLLRSIGSQFFPKEDA